MAAAGIEPSLPRFQQTRYEVRPIESRSTLPAGSASALLSIRRRSSTGGDTTGPAPDVSFGAHATASGGGCSRSRAWRAGTSATLISLPRLSVVGHQPAIRMLVPERVEAVSACVAMSAAATWTTATRCRGERDAAMTDPATARASSRPSAHTGRPAPERRTRRSELRRIRPSIGAICCDPRISDAGFILQVAHNDTTAGS